TSSRLFAGLIAAESSVQFRGTDHVLSGVLLHARESKEERRALPRFTLDPDSSAVRLDDAAGDEQSETRTTPFVAATGLEGLENALNIFRWNTHTYIAH